MGEAEAIATGRVTPAAGRLGAAGLALAIAVADLWSKAAVFAELGLHERRALFGTDWLAFMAVENRGVMWGAFQEWGFVLPWLRAVAAIVVIAMLCGTHPRARLTLVALGLVLGGAVGNVYDGFVHRAVRDFILVDLDVRFFDPFPVFNVADSAICVGVGLLALGMLLERRHPE